MTDRRSGGSPPEAQLLAALVMGKRARVRDFEVELTRPGFRQHSGIWYGPRDMVGWVANGARWVWRVGRRDHHWQVDLFNHESQRTETTTVVDGLAAARTRAVQLLLDAAQRP